MSDFADTIERMGTLMDNDCVPKENRKFFDFVAGLVYMIDKNGKSLPPITIEKHNQLYPDSKMEHTPEEPVLGYGVQGETL